MSLKVFVCLVIIYWIWAIPLDQMQIFHLKIVNTGFIITDGIVLLLLLQEKIYNHSTLPDL